MITVLYPGSFDPYTNGHLEVTKKAAFLFPRVFLNLGTNRKKTRRFNINDMKVAIEQVLKREGLSNVIVTTEPGLTYKIGQNQKVDILIGGLRNETDYAYEEAKAKVNEGRGNLDTLYLRAGALYGHLSSSLTMELYDNGDDVSDCLPPEILELVQNTSQ